MILLHIIGGFVGLTSGAVALSAGKGSKLYRKSGMIFVYAMLVLPTSGAVMAALKPEQISVIAGMLTFYLVITAWHTVQRHEHGFEWMNVAALVFALVISLLSFSFGIQGLIGSIGNDTGNVAGGSPLGFIFGTVALLAAFGDLRMLLTRSLPWSQRIARHLLRICF